MAWSFPAIFIILPLGMSSTRTFDQHLFLRTSRSWALAGLLTTAYTQWSGQVVFNNYHSSIPSTKAWMELNSQVTSGVWPLDRNSTRSWLLCLTVLKNWSLATISMKLWKVGLSFSEIGAKVYHLRLCLILCISMKDICRKIQNTYWSTNQELHCFFAEVGCGLPASMASHGKNAAWKVSIFLRIWRSWSLETASISQWRVSSSQIAFRNWRLEAWQVSLHTFQT